MKILNLLLLLLSLTLTVSYLGAEDDMYATPKLGTPTNGGIFLHREPIEMYWDDWIAYPLMDKKLLPSTDQVYLLIKSEGKMTAFLGVLSINCNNGKYFWDGTPSNGAEALNESNIKEVVPQQVITNAITLFCKK